MILFYTHLFEEHSPDLEIEMIRIVKDFLKQKGFTVNDDFMKEYIVMQVNENNPEWCSYYFHSHRIVTIRKPWYQHLKTRSCVAIAYY